MSRARCSCGILVLSALLFTTASLAACGVGVSDDDVVRVGKASITRSTVGHWMSVIAGEVSTAANQPKPEVPEPPHYSACIAYRQRFPTAPTSAKPRPAPLELKHECEFELQKEKLKALYFLISCDWVSGEAAELGVSLTGNALEQQLALLKGRFPNEAMARRFLVGTRGTLRDLLLRLKLILLTAKIQQKLEKQSHKKRLTVSQRQQVLNRFSEQFASKWRSRTSCRFGYVVPICRQYKVPKVPPTLVPPSVPLTNMTAE